jgi:hypothetical protein
MTILAFNAITLHILTKEEMMIEKVKYCIKIMKCHQLENNLGQRLLTSLQIQDQIKVMNKNT